jgi:hypothetical protein
MGALIVSALVAIALVSAGLWWFKLRVDKVRIDRLTTSLAASLAGQKRAEEERDAAKAENASLREKNDLLSYLGGKVASSWPTP